MNIRTNNKRKMIDSMFQYLQGISEHLQHDNHFQELYARFDAQIKALDSLSVKLGTLRVPFAERKAQARESFLLWMERLAMMLLIHAKEAHLVDAYEETKVIMPRLRMNRVLTALDAANAILKHATAHAEALRLQSRGEEVLIEARKAYALYDSYGLKGSYRKVEASVVYAQYKQALDGCVDFVQTNLYTYFLTWSDVYPSYFEQFELFKRVPKQGARPAKNKESQEVPTAMEAMPDEQSMVYTTAPDEVAQAPYALVANG